jgi:ribosomal protein S18 acetylase RimI-like enzyme
MEEFNQYIQSIDPLKWTEYRTGSTEYFIKKMMKEVRDQNGIIYIATKNNTVIGFIAGYCKDLDEDEIQESIPQKQAHVSELYVREAFRGTGVAQALFSAIEVYFKEKGRDTLRLFVFAPNERARQFYKKEGFEERSLFLMKSLK